MKTKRVSVKTYLKCRMPEGVRLRAVDEILASSDLQERCLEQRALNRIMGLVKQDPDCMRQLQDFFEKKKEER